MGYASKLGRARIDARSPEAAGQCDRCGLIYQFRDLSWQYDYRGVALANLRLLVCDHCLDTPQAQLKAIVLPADPPSIINARETDYKTVEVGNDPPIGLPNGLDPNAVMPFNGATLTAYRVPLAVLSVVSNGTTTVSATCSEPHGLATNGQVGVEGLADPRACGFFSVTVTTATAFSYDTAVAVPATSLLTPTSLVLTANIGLPYGVTQIPQVIP